MQMRSIRHVHAAATGDLWSHGSGGMDMSERPTGLHCRGVNRINGRRPNIAEAEPVKAWRINGRRPNIAEAEPAKAWRINDRGFTLYHTGIPPVQQPVC